MNIPLIITLAVSFIFVIWIILSAQKQLKKEGLGKRR